MKAYHKLFLLISVFVIFIHISNCFVINNNENSHSIVKKTLTKRQADEETSETTVTTVSDEPIEDEKDETESSFDDTTIVEMTTDQTDSNNDNQENPDSITAAETITEASVENENTIENTTTQETEAELINETKQDEENTTQELLNEETTTEQMVKAEDPVDQEETQTTEAQVEETKAESILATTDSTTTIEQTSEIITTTEPLTSTTATQSENVNDDQNNKDFDENGLNAEANEITKDTSTIPVAEEPNIQTTSSTIEQTETTSSNAEDVTNIIQTEKNTEETAVEVESKTTAIPATQEKEEITEEINTINTSTTTQTTTITSSSTTTTTTSLPISTSSRRSRVYFKQKSLIFHLNDTITDETFINKHCPSLSCEFGFRTDLNGKPLCDCFNPCYEKKCGNKVCVIKQNSETDFEPECYDPINLARPPKCYMPLAPGNCRDYTSRYYYNPFKRDCVHFIYTGCNGNGNNFPDWETCQMECNACSLPPQKGPCHAKILRYYYDSSTRQCTGFEWGGCKGNENNFASRIHCEESCKDRKKGSLFLNGMKKTYINEYHRKSNNRP